MGNFWNQKRGTLRAWWNFWIIQRAVRRAAEMELRG